MTRDSAAQAARQAFLRWAANRTDDNNRAMFAALRRWDGMR